jgi:hypothetical protein
MVFHLRWMSTARAGRAKSILLRLARDGGRLRILDLRPMRTGRFPTAIAVKGKRPEESSQLGSRLRHAGLPPPIGLVG